MCEIHQHDATEHQGGISEFIDELVVTITSRRIYWADHPRVRAALDGLQKLLEAQFESLRTKRIEIGLSEGYLFFRKRPLLGASLSAPRIIRPLIALGSGGIEIKRGVQADELLALVDLLGQKVVQQKTYKEANEVLASDGCTRIRLLATYDPAATEKDDEEDFQEDFATIRMRDHAEVAMDLDIPLKLYQDVVHHLQDVMVRVCRGDNLGAQETRGFVEAILKRLSEDAKTMMSVVRYEQYDAFTFGHSIRVCFLALHFAKHLTQDQEMLQRIGLAAILHDVGKAWVPFEVLHNRGRLSAEERLEMNKHTDYGAEMLLETPDPDPLAVSIAFGHHRTTSGGGYPAVLHRADLSAATKIVKICDVYEALTAVRPYKERMSATRAYRIMISMEDHFDPALLRRFIFTNGVYPTGSRVELSDGSVARVADQTGSPLLPRVEVEVDPGGLPVKLAQRAPLDLSNGENGGRLSVARALLDAEY